MSQVMTQARSKAVAAAVLTRAGVIRPHGPRTLVSLVRIMRGYGLGLAGALGSAAARFPERDAIVDERGSVTYLELDERTNAVADVLASRGIAAGDRVALLARNHRGFVDAPAARSSSAPACCCSTRPSPAPRSARSASGRARGW